MKKEKSKERLLKNRWKDQEERIQKIIKSAKKQEDWTIHLEGLRFVEEVEPRGMDKFGRDLRGAQLKNSDLIGVDFRKANLNEANLNEADLSESNLDGASLERARMSMAILRDASLRETNLIAVHLASAFCNGANFSNSDLSGGNARKATFLKANLSRANLSKAKLSGTRFSQANLNDANFAEAKIRGAKLVKADLSGANLIGADLEGANLKEANLIRANLTGAKLGGAIMIGANMSRAVLKAADLRESDLRQSNIVGADFSSANISRAKVFGIFPWQTKAEGIIAGNLDFTPEGTGGGEAPAFFKPALPAPQEGQLIIEIEGLKSAGELGVFLIALEKSFSEVCDLEYLVIEHIQKGSLLVIMKVGLEFIRKHVRAMGAVLDPTWEERQKTKLAIAKIEIIKKFLAIANETESFEYKTPNGTILIKRPGEKVRFAGDPNEIITRLLYLSLETKAEPPEDELANNSDEVII